MIFYLAVFAMIFVAAILSKKETSPVTRKWSVVVMACLFYPLVLWEMRDFWGHPMFFIFPAGMLISLVSFFFIDWRAD